MASLNTVISRINSGIHAVDEKLVVAQGSERFFIHEGPTLSTITDLRNELPTLSDEQYSFHVTADRNDFANWVEHVLHEPLLGAKIRKAKSKKDMIRIMGLPK